MNLGQYIHQLLPENEIVIIPGFGAFVSNYKPAEILEETGEIIPPSKEVTFNPKIRNNDGLLVGFIAENESISHFDALKRIEKERENIAYQLDKGEKVTLEETGVLFLNERQEIEFESFIRENLLLDSFGLEAVVPEEEIISEVEESKPEEPVAFETPPETEEVPEIEDTQTPAEQTEPVETIEFLEEQTEEVIFSEEQKTEIISEEVTGKKEPLPEKKEEPELVAEILISEEPKEKKKKGSLWFLLIFIPLIVAGIFVAKNNSDKKKTNEESQKNITIQETPQIGNNEPQANQSTDDSLQNLVSDSTENIKPEPENTSRALFEERFYLVGGSFKEEENAQKFIDQFDINGYEPFFMGQIGQFYFVGIGKYKTEREAVDAKNAFLKKIPDSGAWVYEKPQE